MKQKQADGSFRQPVFYENRLKIESNFKKRIVDLKFEDSFSRRKVMM